jgi:hypothetical protein
MKVGDLVMQKVVHKDQEEPRLLMIIKTETVEEPDWPLCVEVMDLELGTHTACFDWQLEVIDA